MLPFQFVVGHGHQVSAHDVVVHHVAVEVIGRLGLIGIEVLVTGETVGRTEFHQVDEAQAFDELFVVEVPAQADRPEGTPAVVGTEDGRTVVAQGDIGHIAVIIRIVHGTGDTDFAGRSLAARRTAVFCILTGKRDVVHAVVEKAPGGHAVTVGSRGVQAPSCIGEQHVFAKLAGVVGSDVG